ncbi:hypothetical protein [Actinoallomurus soli]|uniref:hypothetical protein n=1 Tax=Actinoallomurus soli TaxID=2952535 RepID=UPI002093F083|nr:hypothetical protein [Actinoallomurus soli]MCO5970029.1 hypothetical protein [Actinoallomurus soli]
MNQRKPPHGFLVVYLGALLTFSIVWVAYDVVMMLLWTGKTLLHSGWIDVAALAFDVIGVVCLLALCRGKKWGFYGYVLLCTAELGFEWTIVGYSRRDLVFTFAVLVGLCLALQVGGERQGWKQLE